MIISLEELRKKQRLLLFLFVALFCTLPFQKLIKGCLGRIASSWIPHDLPLPDYFTKTIPLYLSDLWILLFIICLGALFRSHLVCCLKQKVVITLFCFLGVSLLSILFSKAAHYPLQYVHLLHFALYPLLFAGICALYPLFGLQSLVRGFAFGLMLLGTFEASIALLQYMLQAPCGLEMLGELHPNHFCFAKEGTTIHLFGKTATEPLMRAAGTFLHPNILGCFLFASSLSTLYLKRTSGFLFLFFLQWMGLFATFSRSALLATAIAFPLFLALLAYKKMIPRYLFIKLGTLFVCLVLIFLPALKSRGGIFSYEGTVKGADQERIHYNKIAINLLEEHPWFGVGHNNFQLYSSYTDPSMPGHTFFSKVHNIYLLVASETGLLGLGCFLFFLFQLFFPLAQNWTQEKIFLLSLFLGFLLIGGCDFFLLYNAPACVLFFSTASLLFLSKQRTL